MSTPVEVRTNARHGFFTPANSTAIAARDAVMLDTNNRLAPLTATALGAARFVGFCTDKWSNQVAIDTHGNGDAYTTPGSFQSGNKILLPVAMEDTVVKLAITETSGKAGNTVYASTLTSGAMVFTLLKPASAIPVGRIEKDFTGATAGDVQDVIVIPVFRNTCETDIQHWINNHVEHGLVPAFDCTSLISYTAGAAIVNGRAFAVARATAALGVICASSTTKARTILYYIGLGGTARIKDTKGVLYTMTTAGATPAAAARNSQYFPSFSLEGVIFGAACVRTASSDIRASHVVIVRRSAQDFGFRKYITANPTTTAPVLR